MKKQKRASRIRGVALATAICVLSAYVGCGYILHPERRGNTGGTIDGVTLVLDILWFIPGIIPGVVALAVDFSSGAIYTGGGRVDKAGPKTKIIVKRPKVRKKTRFEVRVMEPGEETVLGSAKGVFKPTDEVWDKLVVDLEPIRKQLGVEENGPAEVEVVLLIDGKVHRRAPFVLR
jgi:hypothetical protein